MEKISGLNDIAVKALKYGGDAIINRIVAENIQQMYGDWYCARRREGSVYLD